MKQILHVLRKKDDAHPMEVIRRQVALSHRVTVIFTQDAIHSTFMDGLRELGVSILALSEDALGTPKHSGTPISYREMLSSIFSADTVVVW